jgi:hypothetical protein
MQPHIMQAIGFPDLVRCRSAGSRYRFSDCTIIEVLPHFFDMESRAA